MKRRPKRLPRGLQEGNFDEKVLEKVESSSLAHSKLPKTIVFATIRFRPFPLPAKQSWSFSEVYLKRVRAKKTLLEFVFAINKLLRKPEGMYMESGKIIQSR